MQITCALKETSGFRALLTALLAERSNCRGLWKKEGASWCWAPLSFGHVWLGAKRTGRAPNREFRGHYVRTCPCLLLPVVCFTHTPENRFGSYNQAP